MSIIDDVGRGLIRWTPKILEASADDIARFGPNAARVRALLNFIPGISDDAAEIGRAASTNASRKAWHEADFAKDLAAKNAGREAAMDEAMYAAFSPKYSLKPWPTQTATTEVASDLITPEAYRTLTNPMASARALDRLAGRAPESFVPIARDLGERGLVTAPSDIVSAFRISKLPPHVQPLVTGLVDSGLTLEEAIAAARALS